MRARPSAATQSALSWGGRLSSVILSGWSRSRSRWSSGDEVLREGDRGCLAHLHPAPPASVSRVPASCLAVLHARGPALPVARHAVQRRGGILERLDVLGVGRRRLVRVLDPAPDRDAARRRSDEPPSWSPRHEGVDAVDRRGHRQRRQRLREAPATASTLGASTSIGRFGLVLGVLDQVEVGRDRLASWGCAGASGSSRTAGARAAAPRPGSRGRRPIRIGLRCRMIHGSTPTSHSVCTAAFASSGLNTAISAGSRVRENRKATTMPTPAIRPSSETPRTRSAGTRRSPPPARRRPAPAAADAAGGGPIAREVVCS